MSNNNDEKMIGRIKAVLHGSEITIENAKSVNDRDIVLRTKERAYEDILGIIKDINYVPWQE